MRHRIRRAAAPLLRFRTRDHVEVWTTPCACGRTAPRVRCIGRTDDMLIVRGVNVFPSALREIVAAYFFGVSGKINAFTVASQIPSLVRAFVGVLSAFTLIPAGCVTNRLPSNDTSFVAQNVWFPSV